MTLRTQLSLSVTLIALLSSNSLVTAQTPPENEEINLYSVEENKELFTFSANVPQSPALALSGLDASKVTSVSEVRKFAFTLPSIIGSDGQTAIALDIGPYAILSKKEFPFEDVESYAKGKWINRILYRGKVNSLISSGTASEDPAQATRSLLVFGASTSLFDGGDPLYVLGSGKSDEATLCAEEIGKAAIEQSEIIVHKITYSSFLDEMSEISDLIGDELIENPVPDEKPVYILNPETSQAERHNIGEKIERIAESMLSQLNATRNEKGLSDEVLKAPEYNNNAALESFEKFNIFVQKLSEKYSSNTYDFSTKLKNVYSRCNSIITQSLQLAPSLDIGGAFLYRGRDKKLGNFKSGGQALWFSGRYGLNDNCKIDFSETAKKASKKKICTGNEGYLIAGFSGRAGFDETLATGDENLPNAKADKWEIWGGLEYRKPSWQTALRYGYVDTEFSDATASEFSSSGERWLVSADFKLNKSMWLGFTYGEAGGTNEKLDGEQLLVSLKFSNPERYNIFGTKFD